MDVAQIPTFLLDLDPLLCSPSEIGADKTRVGVKQIAERDPNNNMYVRISISESGIVF